MFVGSFWAQPRKRSRLCIHSSRPLMLSFYSQKNISYDGNKIGRATVLHLGHRVLPVNNSVSHIVKCSALVSMSETDFAPENSRRCAKIALGNKIASEP